MRRECLWHTWASTRWQYLGQRFAGQDGGMEAGFLLSKMVVRLRFEQSKMMVLWRLAGSNGGLYQLLVVAGDKNLMGPRRRWGTLGR